MWLTSPAASGLTLLGKQIQLQTITEKDTWLKSVIPSMQSFFRSLLCVLLASFDCVGVSFPFSLDVCTDSLPLVGYACALCQCDPGRPPLRGVTVEGHGDGEVVLAKLALVLGQIP